MGSPALDWTDRPALALYRAPPTHPSTRRGWTVQAWASPTGPMGSSRVIVVALSVPDGCESVGRAVAGGVVEATGALALGCARGSGSYCLASFPAWLGSRKGIALGSAVASRTSAGGKMLTESGGRCVMTGIDAVKGSPVSNKAWPSVDASRALRSAALRSSGAMSWSMRSMAASVLTVFPLGMGVGRPRRRASSARPWVDGRSTSGRIVDPDGSWKTDDIIPSGAGCTAPTSRGPRTLRSGYRQTMGAAPELTRSWSFDPSGTMPIKWPVFGAAYASHASRRELENAWQLRRQR